ncbi:MCP four helix bundle domain-containing protein [Chitinophaga horti]|uniref:MCP four helix bundle domain-containing protein n=1 Tax=Chitinophaga horti TaxID=2920382 RepID=A0ABY6J6U0_9BACT|nr:MCP four helix bundle domain-containing protein [Chitinophaga horti]UYQ95338.1 MCP four helix bundle domain-containing protein [Chitinophaga horti]
MNWLLQVKGKRYKICAIFVMIMVLVLLQNVLERRSISNLDHSVAAIYQDRLLPATYLYGISNHLYQQRQLQPGDATSRAAHNRAIAGLVKEYELTHLTPEEGKQWLIFKARWKDYEQHGTDAAFLKSLESLNSLSDIQVAEGKVLQRYSKTIVNSSFFDLSSRSNVIDCAGIAGHRTPAYFRQTVDFQRTEARS